MNEDIKPLINIYPNNCMVPMPAHVFDAKLRVEQKSTMNMKFKILKIDHKSFLETFKSGELSYLWSGADSIKAEKERKKRDRQNELFGAEEFMKKYKREREEREREERGERQRINLESTMKQMEEFKNFKLPEYNSSYFSPTPQPKYKLPQLFEQPKKENHLDYLEIMKEIKRKEVKVPEYKLLSYHSPEKTEASFDYCKILRNKPERKYLPLLGLGEQKENDLSKYFVMPNNILTDEDDEEEQEETKNKKGGFWNFIRRHILKPLA